MEFSKPYKPKRRTYVCPFCGDKFPTRKARIAHVMKEHSSEFRSEHVPLF